MTSTRAQVADRKAYRPPPIEPTVAARLQLCDLCLKVIAVGQPYVRQVYTLGKGSTAVRRFRAHEACWKHARREYRVTSLAGAVRKRWPDLGDRSPEEDYQAIGLLPSEEEESWNWPSESALRGIVQRLEAAHRRRLMAVQNLAHALGARP